MMTLWKRVGAGVAAVLVSVGAAAPAWSSELSPIGAWNLQRTAESCYLTRSFEDDTRKIRLFVQSFGASTPYVISLTGDGLPLRDQHSEAVQIGFGGEQEAKTILGVVGKVDGQPAMILAAQPSHPVNMLGWLYYRTHIDLVAPVDPAATTLYIDAVEMAPATLQTGAMEAEFARLDECAQALEQQWRVATPASAGPASPPQLIEGKEASWRTKYPENLLLNRISGLVQLRMTVGEDGKARQCVVQASIWARRFGEDACSKLQRWARFEPAKDAGGKPVPALYRTAVLFAIFDW